MNTLKKSTLEGCFRELMRRGYETVYCREIGLHRLISEFLEELEPDAEEYTIFGNVIVRIADSWQEDAEVYIAEQ